MIYGGYFDVDQKQSRINEIEQQLSSAGFWDNKEQAEQSVSELSRLNKELNLVLELKETIETYQFYLNENDEAVLEEIINELDHLTKQIEELALLTLFSDELDDSNAILEINSGAGGTEANDWADMLRRMYLRWADSKGFKVNILSETKGEEVGIKSSTIEIIGDHPFGHLKSESGVHRLVRLSPFDSNNKRHTSFAGVSVTPLLDNEINIELKEGDLKIDVFRSGGAGGQSVNTTDSAVRITHLPTGIVVTCQNERSQLTNKETALKILKNKLYQLAKEKQVEDLNELKSGNLDINFGSQIRSYVMHPYSMVKDLRTNFETSNVSKVLDGDLDPFIFAYLKGGFHE